MQLSPGLIAQFRALHLVRYGEEISFENAEQLLKELAGLVRITLSKEETKK